MITLAVKLPRIKESRTIKKICEAHYEIESINLYFQALVSQSSRMLQLALFTRMDQLLLKGIVALNDKMHRKEIVSHNRSTIFFLRDAQRSDAVFEISPTHDALCVPPNNYC